MLQSPIQKKAGRKLNAGSFRGLNKGEDVVCLFVRTECFVTPQWWWWEFSRTCLQQSANFQANRSKVSKTAFLSEQKQRVDKLIETQIKKDGFFELLAPCCNSSQIPEGFCYCFIIQRSGFPLPSYQHVVWLRSLQLFPLREQQPKSIPQLKWHPSLYNGIPLFHRPLLLWLFSI